MFYRMCRGALPNLVIMGDLRRLQSANNSVRIGVLMQPCLGREK